MHVTHVRIKKKISVKAEYPIHLIALTFKEGGGLKKKVERGGPLLNSPHSAFNKSTLRGFGRYDDTAKKSLLMTYVFVESAF